MLQYKTADNGSKTKISERIKELDLEIAREKSLNLAASEEKKRMAEKVRLTREIYNDLKLLLLECLNNRKSAETENNRLKSVLRDQETESNQIFIAIQREKSQISQLEAAIKALSEKIEKETPLSQEVDLSLVDENEENLKRELSAIQEEIVSLKDKFQQAQTQDSQLLENRFEKFKNRITNFIINYVAL